MAGSVRAGRARYAAAAVASVSVVGLGHMAALARPAAGNVTGNPYFPLVAGASWTYKATSGPVAGSSTTTRVVAVKSSSAGTVVDMRDSSAAGAVSLTYVIARNGSIEFEGGSTAGGAKGSFSGSGDYFIPDARQVTSCSPCTFGGTFTTKVATETVRQRLGETVRSLGMQHVRVPAGSFVAEKMMLSITLTTTGTPYAMGSTTTFYDFLARNVGVVESGGGTITSSVAGHSFKASTGTEELVKYVP